MKKYYEAYDERYKEVHSKGIIWGGTQPSLVIEDVIDQYKIEKPSKILDLGCGEGRDSINLLKKGYNVLGIDVSQKGIEKCNELCKSQNIKGEFKQFDVVKNAEFDQKFDFIYSIAVIHMLVKNSDRCAFFQFINSNLKEEGIALVVSMGDGTQTYKSDPKTAFKKAQRECMETGEIMNITGTSCRVETLENLKKEAASSGLQIINEFITTKVYGFDKCIALVLKK